MECLSQKRLLIVFGVGMVVLMRHAGMCCGRRAGRQRRSARRSSNATLPRAAGKLTARRHGAHHGRNARSLSPGREKP